MSPALALSSPFGDCAVEQQHRATLPRAAATPQRRFRPQVGYW